MTSQGTASSPSGRSVTGLRWVTATLSPCAANARAIASPIPRFPPVTSTLRPSATAQSLNGSDP